MRFKKRRAGPHLLPADGLEAALAEREVTRHQRKEVAGLGEGVLPHSEVPAWDSHEIYRV